MASTKSVLERMIAAMNRGGDARSKASSGLDPQGSGQAHLRVRGSLDPASGMLLGFRRPVFSGNCFLLTHVGATMRRVR
jgi:hypothetical protein